MRRVLELHVRHIRKLIDLMGPCAVARNEAFRHYGEHGVAVGIVDTLCCSNSFGQDIGAWFGVLEHADGSLCVTATMSQYDLFLMRVTGHCVPVPRIFIPEYIDIDWDVLCNTPREHVFPLARTVADKLMLEFTLTGNPVHYTQEYEHEDNPPF